MEGGGGGEKKKQPGTSSGGAGDMTMTIADELSGRKGKAVDPNPTSLSSAGAFHPDATVMERQRIAGRRSVPSRFRPPAPRQYDVSKKQSTNKEVEEEGLRNSADESVGDSTFLTSSVNYGGRHYHTSPAPTDPPRDPTIDELFSGEINPDVAYRGDWWRGGLYY